jgi:hypothetical protein
LRGLQNHVEFWISRGTDERVLATGSRRRQSLEHLRYPRDLDVCAIIADDDD